jgi:hypothetical protein
MLVMGRSHTNHILDRQCGGPIDRRHRRASLLRPPQNTAKHSLSDGPCPWQNKAHRTGDMNQNIRPS